MKISRRLLISLSVLMILGFAACSGTVEVPDPVKSSTAQISAATVRLAICHPSMGSIKALENLRREGLLDIADLHVTGIFHGAEKRIYSQTQAYIEKEGLEWLTLLELDEDIPAEDLFKENNLSDNFREIFDNHDGIIFFGGADIPPYVYGQETNLLSGISTPIRSLYECSFIFHLIGGSQDLDFSGFLEEDPDYPVLGICLGSQTLNVGAGGTLIQDIANEIYRQNTYEGVARLGRENWHTNPYARIFPELRLMSYNLHPIRLAEDGKFVAGMGFSSGDFPYIMSAHHQAVEEIGKDLRVIATSMDGKVVEALDHIRFPNVLGVQFHPEFPMLYNAENLFRITPEDKDETSAPEILAANPPSRLFHEKIWGWFGATLMVSHKK